MQYLNNSNEAEPRGSASPGRTLGDSQGASAKTWGRETSCVPLNRLIADGGVHARRRVLPQTVLEYLELSHDEARKLPPVTAFYDPADPNCYWLADGFLRTYAWRRAGHESVPVNVLPGNRRDAMLYACGTNTEHGVRRSRNDKWNTVVAMLQEPEWAAESDNWIAEKCAVSVTFVKQVREDCVTPEAYVEAQLRRSGTRKKLARKDAKQEARLREIYGDSSDSPMRPMTDQEIFDRKIGWAHRTAYAACQAASAASRAYPEASRLTALTALSDARIMLQDLLPASARAKLPAPSPEQVAEAEQAVEMLAYLGVHVDHSPDQQPATNQGRETRGERRVGRERDAQPATNQPRQDIAGRRAPGQAPLLLAPPPSSLAPPSSPPPQPATNHPARPLFSPFDDDELDVMNWPGPAQIETYYPSKGARQPATNQGREARDEGRAGNQPATNRAGWPGAEGPAPAISNLKSEISNSSQPATNHPPGSDRPFPRPPP